MVHYHVSSNTQGGVVNPALSKKEETVQGVYETDIGLIHMVLVVDC